MCWPLVTHMRGGLKVFDRIPFSSCLCAYLLFAAHDGNRNKTSEWLHYPVHRCHVNGTWCPRSLNWTRLTGSSRFVFLNGLYSGKALTASQPNTHTHTQQSYDVPISLKPPPRIVWRKAWLGRRYSQWSKFRTIRHPIDDAVINPKHQKTRRFFAAFRVLFSSTSMNHHAISDNVAMN